MSSDAPETVGQAIAQGWEAIRVECVGRQCAAGHRTTEIPWTMVPPGLGRELSKIVGRLRCRGCGRPPTAIYLHKTVADNGHGPPTLRRLSLDHLIRSG